MGLRTFFRRSSFANEYSGFDTFYKGPTFSWHWELEQVKRPLSSDSSEVGKTSITKNDK